MKVTEIIQIFQSLPVCDRIYLMCQMIQRCVPHEQVYIKTVLTGTVQESIDSLSNQEAFVNDMELLVEEYSLIDNIDKLICSLALIHSDNRPLADKLYRLLDNRQILLTAENSDDKELLNKLRLLYVLAVYHPVFTFSQRHHLLSVYLRHLDELYHHVAEYEEHNKREDIEPSIVDQERPAIPSDDAIIVRCELKGVYKRQSDRRYPYIVEVEWSDGAFSVIYRTYGDFFSFQNKLLDTFPEESGQRNKKQRIIPFLPGRKLLSGRSNRELAEKRLPDLYSYTNDLFHLSENITTCKHVLDFFKPRPSDFKENVLSQKITTVTDVRNRDSNKKSSVAFLSNSSPSSSPSRPRSAIQNFISPSGSGRGSSTLPTQQSPGQKDKDSTNINRRFTYPARPSAFTPVTPTNSKEKLHSSSQTSIGSSGNDLAPPTTTACHVVTPPSNRSNGSPAFAVSHLNDSDSSSPGSTIKLVRPIKSPSAPGKRKPSNDSPLIGSSTSNNWADRSAPPSNVDTNYTPFQTTVAAGSVTMMTTVSTHPVTSSQIYSYPGHAPSPYPASYTPTNFDSPNPSPKPTASGRLPGSVTPTSHTPMSEFEHFRRWLKCHRLHKYENLFQNFTFQEVSELSVEKMKELGMTQGAAKKLQQKMEELLKSNITSFHEIPLFSITRRPSTASLPAALILERQQLTPSSSIDQLSLHGSTCSLDILSHHAYSQHATPIHLHRHSDSVTDGLLDAAIVEAGPKSVNRRSAIELGRPFDTSRLIHINPDIQSRYSQNSTPSPTRMSNPAPVPSHEAKDDSEGRVHDDKSTNRFTPSPHHFITPQFHRKEHDIYPKIPHALVPTNTTGRIQGGANWPHPQMHSSMPQLVRVRPVVPYAPINGLVRANVNPQSYRITCYNCGSKGHYGSNCTFNKSSYHHFSADKSQTS